MLKLIRLVAIGLVVLGALPAAAQQTLEAVKKRGHLLCGVDGNLPSEQAPTAATKSMTRELVDMELLLEGRPRAR